MDIQNFYRKATAEEVKFYESALYPLQDKVFETASVYEDKIYLTGGTALSRFYYQHRLSEDLDFFTTTNELQLLANDLSERLRLQNFILQIERLDSYFARIFVIQDNCRLKIDFVREFNHIGGFIKSEQGIYINNLEDMGANKVSAFEDRAEIKDVIDLYFITQTISLEHLFELADIKRVPVPYEQLLTINVQGIQGNVLSLIDLNEVEITNFINTLKQRTEAEVKKKVNLMMGNIQKIINKLLWDFPRERRIVSPYSYQVLKRRMKRSPLPERLALEEVLSDYSIERIETSR